MSPRMDTVRAVLVLGSPNDERALTALGEGPIHLCPLLGKSALVYAIEALVLAGVRDLLVLCWAESARSFSLVTDGSRWGCSIEWQTVAGPEDVFKRVADLTSEHEWVLLATSCSLLVLPQEAVSAPSALRWQCASDQQAAEGGRSVPSVWACLDRAQRTVLAESGEWLRWDESLACVCECSMVVNGVGVSDEAGVLRAVDRLLRRELPWLMDASEVDPGIFLSRNVVIHPTVSLLAPVFLAADVRVGAACVVGPGVAVGQRSRIGAGCHLQQVQVGPDTWLGDGLNLQRLLVWGRRVWSASWGDGVDVHDRHVLMHGNPHSLWQGRWGRFLEWWLALLLWLALLPAWLVCAVAHRGCARWPGVAVSLADPLAGFLYFRCWFGATPWSLGWLHALGFVWPNLPGVLFGRWGLSGLRVRTALEWQALPIAEQRWLMRCGYGLIQEAGVMAKSSADVLALSVSADRYQGEQQQTWAYRPGLLLRYVKNLFRQ
jgi:hypothetical protein